MHKLALLPFVLFLSLTSCYVNENDELAIGVKGEPFITSIESSPMFDQDRISLSEGNAIYRAKKWIDYHNINVGDPIADRLNEKNFVYPDTITMYLYQWEELKTPDGKEAFLAVYRPNPVYSHIPGVRLIEQEHPYAGPRMREFTLNYGPGGTPHDYEFCVLCPSE